MAYSAPQSDPSVGNIAVKQNCDALYHAHERLQQDVSQVSTVNRLHPHCALRIIESMHSTLRADLVIVVDQRGCAL
jgi:hypothetical protein